jgi:hypothetical protein
MTASPVALTDPARELAELCTTLSRHSSSPGDEHLASHFEVGVWSSEFYQIIACIVERADSLISITQELDLDDDVKAEAITHIAMIKAAFNRNALTNIWSQQGYGAAILSGNNVQTIKMLSPLIRARISYPKLSPDDVQSILNETTEFERWLLDHQLVEQDFIRQAMLDGIKQFKFRLAKTRWLGWGYTFQSLKDIVAAYKLLETSVISPQTNPDAEAVLRKGASFFVKVFGTIGVAKETVERADFLLRAYGAISLVQHGTSVAGLLTHLKG